MIEGPEMLLIIARHISNDMGVTITFEENVAPHVTGSHIILPSNLALECYDAIVGATFHEAGHIAYTDKGFGYIPHLQPFLNCLEDIRIDNLLFKNYPGIRESYYESLIIDALKNTVVTDSFNAKILKSLILKGEGFEKFDYQDPEIKSFFAKNHKRIHKILKKTTAAMSTSVLIPLAEELASMFMPMEEADQIHHVKQLKKTEKALEEKLKQKREKGQSLYQEKRKTQKRLDKIKKLGKGKDKLQCEDSQDIGNQVKPQDHEEHDTKEEINITLIEEFENLSKVYEKSKRIIRGIRSQIKECQNESSRLKRVLENAYKNRGIPAQIGFFDIETIPFIFTVEDDNKTKIEQTTKEALTAICEVIRKLNFEGGKGWFNPKHVAQVYSAPEKVFSSKDVHYEIHAKIAFLIDSSGSMNGNAGIVLKSLQELTIALDEMLQELPSEQFNYSIFAFDDNVCCLKDFEDDTINWDRYVPKGGTKIAYALNYVEEHLRKLETGESKVIIFCLTDGEISMEDKKFILGFTEYPVIFIGIRPGMTTHELFRRYAINKISDLNSALIRAIEENLLC